MTKKKSQATNKGYDPTVDGPDVAGLSDMRPSAEELVPHATAAQYLEVGLVVGANPKKVKEERKNKRTKGTTTPTGRDPQALRVVIPVTEYVADQSRYYIACKPAGGRCFPRVADGDVVFFYDEFWRGLPDGLNKKQRQTFVNAATKKHAAINKTAIDRSTTALTFTEAEKWTTSNPLAVTRAENLASLLALQFTLYQETENRDHLKALQRTLEEAAPDLVNGPERANAGIAAFFAWEMDFEVDDATNVKRELKVCVCNRSPPLSCLSSLVSDNLLSRSSLASSQT